MEHRMDSTKRKWGGTTTNDGNGPSMWLLPAGGQFYTRSCTRCAGLLVNERSYDQEADGEHDAEVLRCVQCGNHVDSVILMNRTKFLAANKAVQPARHQHTVLTAQPQEEESLLNVV